jgi:signal transduction histidine kinase
MADTQPGDREVDALRSRVEELVFDIGRILHANTSTLLMVNRTLESAAHALAPEQAGERGGSPATAVDLAERLSEGREALARSLERLLASGDEERRAQALGDGGCESLAEQVATLRQLDERVPVPELRIGTLRTTAAQVGARVRAAPAHLLPREPLRAVRRAATELERLASLVDVQTTRQAVLQMDVTLRALRDFITSDVRSREETCSIAAEQLVRDAIAQVREFAEGSQVEIRWRRGPGGAAVCGNPRELVRALSNLLHNAIKYSWHRDESALPWVSIEIHSDEKDVRVEIQNWGVPISREEIEQGLIFELGYRGKWSTDRGRLGTGIGLTDAQRTAHDHGGELRVESRPARGDSEAPDHSRYYRQPFLTQATLRLPLD